MEEEQDKAEKPNDNDVGGITGMAQRLFHSASSSFIYSSQSDEKNNDASPGTEQSLTDVKHDNATKEEREVTKETKDVEEKEEQQDKAETSLDNVAPASTTDHEADTNITEEQGIHQQQSLETSIDDIPPPSRKGRKKKIHCITWIIFVVVILILFGIGLGVGFSIAGRGQPEGDKPQQSQPPIEMNCQQGGEAIQKHPFVWTKCLCEEGALDVSSIPENIQREYAAIKEELLQTITSSLDDFTITSCESSTNLALHWLAEDRISNENTDSLSHRFALAIFFIIWRTNSPMNYLKNNEHNWKGWMTSTSFCGWDGITCNGDDTSKVTSIELNRYGLSNSIPTELAMLSPHLTSLSLHQNSLTGIIPTELGSLEQLQRLDLSGNFLRGSIPSTMGQVRTLQYFNIAHNRLTGSLSASLGFLTDLKVMALQSNQLIGALPRQLGLCTALEELYLYENEISGSIPEGYGRLVNLQKLVLFHNDLDGSLPSATMRSWKSLVSLSVAGNKLTGEIPSTIGSCTALQDVYLDRNQFSGLLPPELSSLKSLSIFELQNNYFSGLLPTELGSCIALSVLDVSNNPFLRGSIPMELGQLPKLKELLVHHTSLDAIPNEICSNDALQMLIGNCGLSCNSSCCTRCKDQS
mmetsp:Transcript_17229/g.26113  ORF Transcript_17229/g.26113 Transcript_17229/m.26113 type:complete len:639 (+) Transcript_17229:26-1942(+)